MQLTQADPYIPEYWGSNKRGMVAGEEIADPDLAYDRWMQGLELACETALELDRLGVHKQHANRVLLPYQHITAIYTATDTEWQHFINLRIDHDAQPEIQQVARMVQDRIRNQEALYVRPGDWHKPYAFIEDDPMVAVARCARVSYLNHEGQLDTGKDLDLARHLMLDGHMSPFEHVCTPADGKHYNLTGWKSLRWMLENGEL